MSISLFFFSLPRLSLARFLPLYPFASRLMSSWSLAPIKKYWILFRAWYQNLYTYINTCLIPVFFILPHLVISLIFFVYLCNLSYLSNIPHLILISRNSSLYMLSLSSRSFISSLSNLSHLSHLSHHSYFSHLSYLSLISRYYSVKDDPSYDPVVVGIHPNDWFQDHKKTG